MEASTGDRPIEIPSVVPLICLLCSAPLQGATRAELDRGRGLASVKELRQEASRHRHRHKPPETPPGFWDMGFMDSLDSRVVGGEE